MSDRIKCIKHHRSKHSFCPECAIEKLLGEENRRDKPGYLKEFVPAVPLKLKNK